MIDPWKRLLDAGRPYLKRFRQAAADPLQAQERHLRSILRDNAESAFGRAHGFAALGSIKSYQQTVPIRGYDALLPWVEAIIAGDRMALTAEPPVAFELTGGDSGGRRLIPYTGKTIAAFQVTVLAWLADLLETYPAIAKGQAYFAISPAVRQSPARIGGLAVGLGSDAAYFGPEAAPAVAEILLGLSLSEIGDLKAWRLATAASLAAASNLSLISVWSPTFLIDLLDTMEAFPEEIAGALHEGRFGLQPAKDRAELFRRAVRDGSLDTGRLWPGLALTSAWADASSRGFARVLAERMPQVPLQPKGLLATEGIFTAPFSFAPHPVPALESAFLEFEDAGGGLHLVDDLRGAEEYGLVVTTPGGLYRYRIGDRVRCMGHTRSPEGGGPLPMLSFVGRGGKASDLIGEKLDEAFVISCLGPIEGFAALIAMPSPRPHYLLLTDRRQPPQADARERAERLLERNPQYAYARRIGQLDALAELRVDAPLARYVDWRLAQGHRLADIKVPVLFSKETEASAIWPEIAVQRERSTMSAPGSQTVGKEARCASY